MAKYENVFSDYEIKNTSIKFTDAEGFKKIGCVGNIEEELEVRVVTKNCEGVVAKSIAKGSGSGSLTISLHMQYDLYVEAFGMEQTGLKEGIVAYGRNSKHKEFALVAEVFDEDGNTKLIAYPRCVMASAPACTIENGAEEVAEVEVEINLFPDEDGNCKYQAVGDGVDELTNTWLTSWSIDIVKNA